MFPRHRVCGTYFFNGGAVRIRKPKFSPTDNALIEQLKAQFGFTSDEEVIRHALILLEAAGKTADPDGTIYVGKGENAIDVHLRKEEK